MKTRQRVIVVGGGPVGALAALYTARRGYDVELYDLRDDPNSGDPDTRPAIALIPLMLSERGIQAIKGAGVPGLIEDILDSSRPLHARMVHGTDRNGNPTETPMPYGPSGECLYSLSREKLAKRLLLALQNEPNATVKFNHKLVSCDFECRVALFEQTHERDADIPILSASRIKEIPFVFAMGCDGAYSVFRQSMMKQSEMDFEQSYINAFWCDFVIPPNSNGRYRLDSQHFHVWPDKGGIVVAQPDFDESFRAGVVIDKEMGRDLEQHPQKVEAFFRKRHPGIGPTLLSGRSATMQFLYNKHIPLMSIKCGNLGYEDSGVLLGDAAHTMVPFHAMGMNTGLEDVRIFFEEFIDAAHRSLQHDGKLKRPFCPTGVIQKYSDHRRPDVHAMTDLSVEHYHELSVRVKSKLSRAEQRIETTLQRRVPALGWATLYSRIQFSNERFSVIRKEDHRQKRIVRSLVPSLLLTLALLWITANLSGALPNFFTR